MPKDRWQDLCKTVAEDDGLPVREVGHWSEEKLLFWNRYLRITTGAMGGHSKWPEGLVYVDLFAGPGVCQIKSSGRRIPGSPLIAANTPKPFRSILLCEMDEELGEACRIRLSKTPAADRVRIFLGDCNKVVGQIAAVIPKGALTLAFVDPEGLDADIETIRTLSNCGRVDLLILFADAYDIVRNVDRYETQTATKLDRALGPDSDWREKWVKLENRTGTSVRKFFADIYKEQLRTKLGYKVFGEKIIKSRKGPLYRLIYASKHPLGLKFWKEATKKDVQGQKDFEF